MIEVNHLTKYYGRNAAVDDVSFTVNDGEIVGLLGPNGAGKTTTMNIMTGYLASTEGDVLISGHNILDEPAKAKMKIGYLPEQPPLYLDMKVDEYLKFAADLKKVKKADRKPMISEIKKTVRVEEMSGRLIKQLSKGYRQRVGLAAAMVGNPEVIILDEPTVGLDPKQIIEMRDVIKKLGKKHTVILSSHIMQEISAVCDRVVIINKGRIVASDTLDNLTKLVSGSKMVVRIKADQRKIKEAISNHPLIKPSEFVGAKEPGTFDVILEGQKDADIREAIFACMAKNNLPILMLQPQYLSLEEIFLKLTSERSGI